MLRLDMTHLSILMDEPCLNAVVVIEAVRSWMKSAHRHQLLSRWLHVTSFVRATRLQCRFIAIPFPPQRKSGRCFWEHGVVDLRVAPRSSAICRNFDTCNAAATGPRQPGDFIRTTSV